MTNMNKIVLEQMKQVRIKNKLSLTAEYQLGYYIGEIIILRHLPTLSVDIIKSRNIIEVNDEDTKKYNELNSSWYNATKVGDKGEKWDAYKAFSLELRKKYLPNPLVCDFPPINIQNLEEFKYGLISSLWDSDICYYDLKLENIKIQDDENFYFTTIELKLD